MCIIQSACITSTLSAGTYHKELLVVLLSERVWFRRLTHAQLVERFSDLDRDVFEQVVSILGKVKAFTAVTQLLSVQDGVVQDNVEVSDCRPQSVYK